MMDYILIWPSDFGRKYVLMLADKMSKMTMFLPTYDTTIAGQRSLGPPTLGPPTGSFRIEERTSPTTRWSWWEKS